MSSEDFTPDDEIVSAYLDNEATPEEVARVEASPELLALAETYRAIDGAVAAPIAPPPVEVREAHIAAALAASATAPNVTSMAAARDKKRGFSPRVLAISGAAAAVILGFIAVVTLADVDPNDDATETAAVVESDTDDAADESGGDDSAGDAAVFDEPDAEMAEAAEPAQDTAADTDADTAAEDGPLADDFSEEEAADEAMADEEMAGDEMADDEMASDEQPAEEAPAAVPEATPAPAPSEGLFPFAFDLGQLTDEERLMERLAEAEAELEAGSVDGDTARGVGAGFCRDLVDESLGPNQLIIYVGVVEFEGVLLEVYGIGPGSEDLPAPLVRLVDPGANCEIALQIADR